MLLWTTRQEWVADTGWFADKVCMCKISKIYHQGYDWKNFNNFETPPTCAECGLWANMLGKCCKCDERFYCFFNHPHMGHHDKPRKGWYCWNCLQTYLPGKVEVMVAARRLPLKPPPSIVLPPGYVIVTGVGYR